MTPSLPCRLEPKTIAKLDTLAKLAGKSRRDFITDWVHAEHHYLSTSERYHRLTLQDITHHEIYLEHSRAMFLGLIQKMREER